MAKRVLGKGLDALIPKKANTASSKEFIYLSLEKIKPAKHQPRQKIGKRALEDLARSIKDKGFIQPIIVRKTTGDFYEVVAGERRFQAAKSLGLKEIPTILKDVDDKDAFILAIVENLQREDLNPIEEAEAFRRLINGFGFSLDQVAQFVAKDKTTVVNALRLLKLPEAIKQALKEGIVSRTQARAILGIDKLGEQEKLFRQILREGLSVREIEKKARLASPRKRKIDPFVAEVEEKLQKALGTKVKIFNKRNNQGRIVIEYYTLKDFERITRRLR
jgi:ParB family chromosome partitioning protein